MITTDLDSLFAVMKAHGETCETKSSTHFFTSDCAAHPQQIGFTCSGCMERFCISIPPLKESVYEFASAAEPWKRRFAVLLKSANGRIVIAGDFNQVIEEGFDALEDPYTHFAAEPGSGAEELKQHVERCARCGKAQVVHGLHGLCVKGRWIVNRYIFGEVLADGD